LKESGEGLIAYEIAGDGFLRHMVRVIVGTLVEVGRGRRLCDNVTELLNCGTRAKAGPTAPPHGLFLVRVDYD
jgi:tRNA pseudouridine38-40 synthase